MVSNVPIGTRTQSSEKVYTIGYIDHQVGAQSAQIGLTAKQISDLEITLLSQPVALRKANATLGEIEDYVGEARAGRMTLNEISEESNMIYLGKFNGQLRRQRYTPAEVTGGDATIVADVYNAFGDKAPSYENSIRVSEALAKALSLQVSSKVTIRAIKE